MDRRKSPLKYIDFRLKLALSSRRAEMVVRLGNHKLKSFTVRMEKWSHPIITMTRFDDEICNVYLKGDYCRKIRKYEVVPKR